jgi:hypothetical protein
MELSIQNPIYSHYHLTPGVRSGIGWIRSWSLQWIAEPSNHENGTNAGMPVRQPEMNKDQS